MQKRKVILVMEMTVDGYIAGPNEETDWINSSHEDWIEMFNDLESVDTFLLGRKMYPDYANYWRGVLADPSSPPDELKYAKLADQTLHIVFTNSDFKPDWKNTRVANNIDETMAQLQAQAGKDIVVWGGATLATSLIEKGLMDEYRITLNPNLLGDGKLLFSNIQRRKQLKLIDAKPLSSGNVILRYQS